jgi:pimeloyl-ACP methyl ester carboxylesterase
LLISFAAVSDLAIRFEAFLREHPRKTLRIGSTDWAYRIAGGGTEGLLLLPGAVGGGEAYFALAESLSGELRSILIEYPIVTGLDEMLSSLAGLLEREGIERTAVLGSSFGGMVAQAFRLRFPERTSRVVLSSTGPPDSARASRNERWLALLRHVPMPLVRALLRLLIRKLLSRVPREREFWQKYYERALRGLSREQLESQYRVAIDFDLDCEAPGPPGEILLLEGSEDSVASRRSREALKSAYPGARVHTFEGAGHGLLLERPEEWLSVVAGFLFGSRPS